MDAARAMAAVTEVIRGPQTVDCMAVRTVTRAAFDLGSGETKMVVARVQISDHGNPDRPVVQDILHSTQARPFFRCTPKEPLIFYRFSTRHTLTTGRNVVSA